MVFVFKHSKSCGSLNKTAKVITLAFFYTDINLNKFLRIFTLILATSGSSIFQGS